MTACPCGRPCPEPLAAWNRDVKDAREDYRRMPIRACAVGGCDGLRDEGSHCRAHRGANRPPKEKR